MELGIVLLFIVAIVCFGYSAVEIFVNWGNLEIENILKCIVGALISLLFFMVASKQISEFSLLKEKAEKCENYEKSIPQKADKKYKLSYNSKTLEGDATSIETQPGKITIKNNDKKIIISGDYSIEIEE